MAISNAQFAAWLANDGPRVFLCEMKFAYDNGAPAEGTLYLATRPYITSPADSPPNQLYRGVISAMPSVARSINPDARGGITAVSVGSMTLDNADGELDFMMSLIVDGRAVSFYLGDPSWARSDFRLVLVLVAAQLTAQDDKTIAVVLQDQRLLLNKELAGDVVNDTRLKPLVFCYNGMAESIEPVQKDAANLIYYAIQNVDPLGGSAISSSFGSGGVYDSGLSIGTVQLFSGNNAVFTSNGVDTLSFAGHGLAVNDVIKIFTITGGSIFAGLVDSKQYWVIAAGLTANNWKVSLTKGGVAVAIPGTTFTGTLQVSRARFFDNTGVDGTIQLSSPASGRLLADLIGWSPTQNHVSGAVGEILRAMLVDYGGIAAGSINAGGFQNADSIYFSDGGQISTARAVLQRENLINVLDDIARVAQLYYGPDYQGVFQAGRLSLSLLATDVATRVLDTSNIFGPVKIVNAPVITGAVNISQRRNHTALTYGEMAGAVSVANRTLFAALYKEARTNTAPGGTGYPTNWQGFYKTAVRAEVNGAWATAGGEGQNAADKMLADLKPLIQTITLTTDLNAYTWGLGDPVRLTYPRYAFKSGKNCRLIGISPDFVAERVALTLLTQTSPNVSAASYP